MVGQKKKKKIGPLGEDIVERFLRMRGYEIIDRNYRRPWGEIDIIAKMGDVIHFVEVKSISRDIPCDNVSSETSKDSYRPEDNLHRWKLLRLSRIIRTYLMGRHVSGETSWKFDVAAVLIDGSRKKARINFIEDIVLEEG